MTISIWIAIPCCITLFFSGYTIGVVSTMCRNLRRWDHE
jgi:hypothetical protein